MHSEPGRILGSTLPQPWIKMTERQDLHLLLTSLIRDHTVKTTVQESRTSLINLPSWRILPRVWQEHQRQFIYLWYLVLRAPSQAVISQPHHPSPEPPSSPSSVSPLLLLLRISPPSAWESADLFQQTAFIKMTAVQIWNHVFGNHVGRVSHCSQNKN